MSGMNFLEKLLDGVTAEWKTLGEIGEFTYGYAAKAQDSGDARFVRITDIDINGKLIATDSKYVDISGENERYLLKKDDLLMARTGATYGKTMIFEEDYPAIYAGFLIKLSFDERVIIPKFYWHFAQSNFFWNQANRLVSGGGQPQFNANVLKDVKILVPPLETQAEIVRILDTFTALTAELAAELTDRKKQYEYYRDRLLTFEKGEVEWKKLGEIYQFSSGLSKSADQFGFGSPFLSYKAVFKNISVPSKLTDLVNTSAVEQGRYSIRKGDVFVTRTSESLDELGMSCAALEDYPMATFNGFTKRLRPKELSQIDPKFSAFFFRSTLFREQIARIAVLSTRVSLNDSILASIKMPVPSLEEQARVVAILDKFDTLTHSISEGLPREIALRQKQYEYYRDLLLTFPKTKEEQ
jgi:type I restriction enzyme, S subunit